MPRISGTIRGMKMSTGSEIEWTDASWNAIAGCTPVSPGCLHCYAATMANRLDAMGQAKYKGLTVLHNGVRTFNGKINLDEKALTIPMRWKKPRRVFVNSMSDLFHENVPFEFIDKVFDVMWHTPRHTYQILTKRPDRLVEYVTERAAKKSHGWTDTSRAPFAPGDFMHFDDVVMRNECGYHGKDYACHHPDKGEDKGKEDTCDCRDCPIFHTVSSRSDLKKIGVADQYKYDSDGFTDDSEWMELHSRPFHAACGNTWLGFSAENQQAFDERFEHFESLRWRLGPEFIFFMSLEPLLGPIDIGPALKSHHFGGLPAMDVPHINWVIVGGESGRGARQCHIEWIQSIVQQCKAAAVPVFVKQLGKHPTFFDDGDGAGGKIYEFRVGPPDYAAIKDPKGGTMEEWPDDLRVRQFPEAQVPA